MYIIKSFHLVVVVLFGLFIMKTFGCFQFYRATPRCNIAYRCAATENITWASNGRRCFVFANSCYLRNENCRRIRQNIGVLNIVTEEKCQLLCSDICPAIFQPVCAAYDGVYTTFETSCTLQNQICKEGKPYILIHAGVCENDLIRDRIDSRIQNSFVSIQEI